MVVRRYEKYGTLSVYVIHVELENVRKLIVFICFHSEHVCPSKFVQGEIIGELKMSMLECWMT